MWQCLNMSTGPRTRAPFIQGHQSTAKQDAPHSALFYLFQEVSKLASPIHDSFLDTDSPTTQLNETSRQDQFIVKKEKGDARSFQTCNGSCQHSWSSCMSAYNQVEKMMEESHNSKVPTLVESHREGSSPWKVLSLINLQCERLLHQRNAKDADPNLVSSITKLSHSTAKSLSAAADVIEQGFGSDSVSGDCALKPSLLIYDREEITASGSAVDDVRGKSTGGAGKLQSCVKDSKVGFSIQPQSSSKTETVVLELVGEKAATSSEPHYKDRREVKIGDNGQSVWNQDWKMSCLSTEQDMPNVPFAENALPHMHISSVLQNTQLTLNSNEEALLGPALTLDCNANIVLTRDTSSETQLPQSSILPSLQSTPLCLSSADKGHPAPQPDNKITGAKPEHTHAPTEGLPPLLAQLQSYNVPSATSKPDLRPEQNEGISSTSTQQWKAKTPRKQPHPSRSADVQDPDFQGVMFRMDRELDDSREQCRLLITSKYSKKLCKKVRKPKLRTRTSQKSLKTSSSDEESELMTAGLKGKVCASCCTRKTPMWRDAEDGTPLCNACGIRYKKYRVRCVNCWHIPKKEGTSNSRCLKCGNFVRLASVQRKHSS
uniref:GATA-type domain-containing protein n=2 Tax=Monopterus albus TaxID=43700 RepID=A0A3Q3KM52_MONAL|nr:GATA-type zinc finger protein 1 isoform X1 [Monopterus albus]